MDSYKLSMRSTGAWYKVALTSTGAWYILYPAPVDVRDISCKYCIYAVLTGDISDSTT